MLAILLQSLRHRGTYSLNQNIILFDNSGYEYLAKIVKIQKNSAEVFIENSQKISRESNVMNSRHPALTFFNILAILSHLFLLWGFVLLEHFKQPPSVMLS